MEDFPLHQDSADPFFQRRREEHEATKTYLRELRALHNEKIFFSTYAACFWTRGSFDASIL